jgi:acylphosphatase
MEMRVMQIRTVIIVKGEVQRVGYRDVVERAARKLKLTGFVENIKPYDVKVVCEGDKASIDIFLELINIKEYPVDVEHLDVKFEEPTGEFDYFEIIRGDMAEELGERLDLAGAKMTIMTQKQDVMIEKLDYNTSVLKDFKSETNENFNKLSNIMSKHDADAKERIVTLTHEISDIKERLTRLESVVG